MSDTIIQKWNPDNVLSFPVRWIFPESSRLISGILDKSWPPVWTEGYFLDLWLDLFTWKHFRADIKLLTDAPFDLIKLNWKELAIDWYVNIWNLLKCPTTSQEVIKARKAILEKINSLPQKLYNELYDTFLKAKKLYFFDEVFSDFSNLAQVVEELEQSENKPSLDRDDCFFSLLDAFSSWAWSLEEARMAIPRHIQLLRNIPDPFFQKAADEMYSAFEKAKDFKFTDLKAILENDDYEAFGKLRKNLEDFCRVFSDWDWILIVAKWIHDSYLKSSKIIWFDKPETVRWLRDGRILLGWDFEKFMSHIPNDVPKGKKLEVYSGWNWSWKSTWLKSRLALQLFHQTYWYVPALEAELPMREQIIFMNRWGSSYWEDLSAFWNDIKRKLLTFIMDIKKNPLIYLDEFWSTIPENEAFWLIKAIEEYLLEHWTSLIIATHNEKYLNEVLKEKSPVKWLYHFNCKINKSWEMDYRYSIETWRDSAHTLNVFRASWLPSRIINKASWSMLWGILNNEKIEMPYPTILRYSEEEREKMKKTIWGFAWFTRYNDMVKVREGKRWRQRFEIMRKFIPLEWEERPNSWYFDADLFFSAHHPRCLDVRGNLPSFDFKAYSKDDKIRMPKHLHPKNPWDEFIYDSTLQWMVTWWLTKDSKVLLERQKFFEEASRIPYEEVEATYMNINTLLWISSWFLSSNIHSRWMNVKMEDFSRFNKAIWEYFFENLDKSLSYRWIWVVAQWFLDIVEIEIILGNITSDYKNLHKSKFDFLEKTVRLARRHATAERRERKWMWKDWFETSWEAAVKIKKRIEEIFAGLISENWSALPEIMKFIWEDIGSVSKWFDILEMDNLMRDKVASHIDDSWIFRSKTDWRWESISDWMLWMLQIIRAMRWTGNLAKPLMDKMKTLDSTIAHSLANYIEDFTNLPDVEEFVRIVRLKRDQPKKFDEIRYDYRIERNHQWAVFYELNGIFSIVSKIKDLGWTKVEYNSTWDIDIRRMYNPSMEKNGNRQVKNDFRLDSSQSFEILEWATMWGKTMNIQSVQWIMRLAHSIWYVPAEYASLPIFDWMIYIDRILEDEKKQLSAGQNDAKIWAEIIAKVLEQVKNKAKWWRYWFAIDEMISSVPARYQKWLVVAIVDELKRLWQRGQISIHNPELVTSLLNLDSESYEVRHPEIRFDEKWGIIYTYDIIPWRSLDKDWHYSAFSLETAEKLGLPDFIADKVRRWRR
ncbi:MAG: DNA mismatch repair protein mutS [uncultured bacterium (gcode 4)]|uniref:DNA mismatch repair protein mutS n=1 Tax=uncultured bacterium (gcode 4) TaxID=1234023 RepID=K2H305_9BACT|nr:MAG: DNA mismatch repair protein mutS [uncultured bacterium (gcode 4)]